MANKVRLMYVQPDAEEVELHVASRLLSTSTQVTGTKLPDYTDGADYEW